MSTHHIAILASGSGTNAEQIMSYFAPRTDVHVALIVSNNPKAGVLQKAKRFKVPTLVIDREKLYKSNYVLEKFNQYGIDFVILAGFLWLVPQNLVAAYHKRIINIHPALLPKYGGKGMYGMHVHHAVIQAGERESGITIHYVNEHYDQGDIIFQARCQVAPNDRPEDLAGKVQALEHLHFPRIIDTLLQQLPHKERIP